MNKLNGFFENNLLARTIASQKYHVLGTLALVVIIRSIKKCFEGGKCTSKTRLDGKTVVITGGNTGIGKETALDLAKRGARVIIACRDVKKGIRAAEEIRRTSGNGNVVVEYLDLASFDSVKRFAEHVNKTEEFVHILINNAGSINLSRKTVNNDIEMHLGVNHLSHYLLTRLLLNKIEASAPSRIVNVSSVAYEKGRMDWDDLMLDKNFDFRKAYRQSKLANVLFTRELAKRLQGTGVNAYCLHPGVVLTEIGRDIEQKHKIIYTIMFYFLYPLLWLFLKKPVNGAQTTIFCAVDESISTKSGRYFCDCKEKTLLPHGIDDASATKLWTLSETLVKSYLE